VQNSHSWVKKSMIGGLRKKIRRERRPKSVESTGGGDVSAHGRLRCLGKIQRRVRYSAKRNSGGKSRIVGEKDFPRRRVGGVEETRKKRLFVLIEGHASFNASGCCIRKK